jgi:hypothetical protein
LLTDALGLAAFFLLIGAGAIGGLVFWLPQVTAVPILNQLFYIFYVVVFCTILRVSVVPFGWAWGIIIRQKRASMAVISSYISPLSKLDSHKSDDEKWVAIYQTVSIASSLPFSSVAMVQYAAAIIGSLVASVLGIVSLR